MNKKTALALEKSIQHWRNNLTSETPSTKSRDCALCEMFRRDWSCVGCPVYKYTGQAACLGTPYVKADTALQSDDILMFKIYAQNEIDFLESLRETK